MMTNEEHKAYHLEVALTGCGFVGCDFGSGLALHFQALNEGDLVENAPLLGDEEGSTYRMVPGNWVRRPEEEQDL